MTRVLVSTSNGNAHLRTDDEGTTLCGAKGSLITRNVDDPVAYITCRRCRRIMGWETISSTYRETRSAGLDTGNAWGANKGR